MPPPLAPDGIFIYHLPHSYQLPTISGNDHYDPWMHHPPIFKTFFDYWQRMDHHVPEHYGHGCNVFYIALEDVMIKTGILNHFNSALRPGY